MKDLMEKLGILFANGGGKKAPEPPDTEEDDFTQPDEDAGEEEEDDYSRLFDEDELEDEEDDDELELPDDDEEEEETEEADEEESSESDEKKLFTQAELEAILKDRLARKDRSFRQEYGVLNQKLTGLERLTGMNIDQIETHIKQAQVKSKADDWGITEEEATRILEAEQKAVVMEQQYESMRRENQQTQRMIKYDRDKAQHMSNPLVKQYMQEIDTFAQHGAALDFEPAMNFIVGKATLDGKLDIKKDIEQKTISNIRKKSKAKPERGGTGGGADAATGSLSREEKELAINLGLSTKEYLNSKKSLESERKLKGR